MLDQIKRIAAQTAVAGDPARFLFGEVTAAAPLKIMVDSRFEISGEMVVVMREFRAGEHLTHVHTVDPHTHGVPAHTADPAGEHVHSVPPGNTNMAQEHVHGIPANETVGAGGHSHGVQAGATEETALETAKETYFGLTVGDRVVLLRNQGGQQYLVLGRV